jgi:hypothetical protein
MSVEQIRRSFDASLTKPGTRTNLSGRESVHTIARTTMACSTGLRLTEDLQHAPSSG